MAHDFLKNLNSLSGAELFDSYKGPVRNSGGVPYDFFIGPASGSQDIALLLPVAPCKMTTKINNSNKTFNLMNEGEINVLKSPGLTEIEFEALLPNTKYPFAVYKSGFQNAKVYLDRLEELKIGKMTFQFIVSRTLPNGSVLFSTNLTCSLEEYSVEEDAESNGTDILVTISLKQFRPYGVKKCKVKTKKTLNLNKLRNKKFYNLPSGSDKEIAIIKMKGTGYVSIKIKKAITIYNLAKKIYGDGSLYTVIAKANCVANESRDGTGKTNLWKKSKKPKKGTMVTIPLSYYS